MGELSQRVSAELSNRRLSRTSGDWGRQLFMAGKICEALLTAGPSLASVTHQALCDAAMEVTLTQDGRSAAAAGWLVKQCANCRPTQRPVAFVISDQSDSQHGFAIIL